MKLQYCLCVILLYVNNVKGEENKESEEDIHRKRLVEQLTKTHTVILDGYQLVSRQVATDVYMFRGYRTVSLVFYPVGNDVTEARFTFQAEELHLNNIGSCEPNDVIVHLKHGSVPAVNPDGYDFPKHFIDSASRDQMYSMELESDGRNRTLTIESPKPGHWYALVYIKWEDPRTQKVEQQGLVAVCQTLLYTDLQVKSENDIQLADCYSGIQWSFGEKPLYKCMSLNSGDAISLNLTVTGTILNNTRVGVKIRAQSLPTDTHHILSCSFDPTQTNIQTITFYPNPSAWHYIQLETLPENYTRIADCESFYLRDDVEEITNQSITELMRDNKGRFFTFDYGLPTTDLQDATSLVNLTSGEIKSLKFNVNPLLDIGGNMAIEASLLMSMEYYMGYKRETKNKLLAFTEDSQFFRAVICLDIDHISVPLETGHCKYNDVVKPALFVLNSTDSDTIYDKTIIPYPESGSWYLTSRLFCDSVVCPCKTSDNNTKYYVNPDGEYVDDVGLSNGTRNGTTQCNATVVLSLSSHSCVSGRCSNHGNCLLNTVGGMVMSFCSCLSGYGGWDCSDDSRIDSRADMLISVLLLTVSNILFFISTYVAIIRLYYIEAMVYTFTMLFSTFYHACDAPAQVAYCIARGSLLQFGDFYCGLMSFWVTLLAMSITSERLKSTLQLLGAIIIALLTTWNMHSFVAFLLPVAVGIVIVFGSWYLDYRSVRKMIYPKSYYTRHFPFGLVLVSVGLICYAFLQTENNYKIVHSFWHMIIALSVVFLLPDNKRGEDVHPFLPTPGYCSLPFCGRIFNRNPSPITADSE